jgi:hypothetical protein
VVTSDRSSRRGRKASSRSAAAGSAARAARSFYAKAISAAEQESLAEAMGVDGLDEEIALMRLRLFEAVKDTQADVRLMFEGAALLSRLVATKFKLSQSDAGELKAAIEYAVNTLGEMGREAGDGDA